MSKKVTGLGRGLSALIDEAVRPSRDEEGGAPSSDRIAQIEVGRIRPNPHQPRRHFDEEALAELAASIAERGVLQPILVRPSGDGYELVAGERRWRAAQRARLHRIPAVVRELNPETSAEIALIENIQRQDLNALEEAEGYARLIAEFGHSQEEVGQLVAKSRSHVANLLRLLDLPDEPLQMLMRGEISMGHARALIGTPDPTSLAQAVVAQGWSVRQTEARAREAKNPAAAPTPRPRGRSERAVDADLAALERQLGDLLGLKVRISHGTGGGHVQLHYASLDQLDLICQRLSGEPI